MLLGESAVLQNSLSERDDYNKHMRTTRAHTDEPGWEGQVVDSGREDQEWVVDGQWTLRHGAVTAPRKKAQVYCHTVVWSNNYPQCTIQ